MRALLLCCLILIAAPVLAQRDYTAPADAERTDVWFDPTDSGWALTIAPSGAISSALLTDFDAAGAPRWWFGGAVRAGPGQVAMALYRPRWDVARQQLGGATQAGQLNFVRHSEDAAHVVLQLDGRTREHTLVRYVVNRDFSLGDRSGFWFDPVDGGHGQLLIQQGRWVGSISLGYDRGGEPTWAFAQGDIGEGLLAATRVRRVCDPGCRLLSEAGGETRIRFRGQDDAIASITLGDAQGVFWSRPDKALSRYTEAPNTRLHAGALARFSDAAAMTHFVQQTAAHNPYYNLDGCIDFSPGVPAATTASDTNVQEEGVGEYDLIQRIGSRVYSLSARDDGVRRLRLHVLDAASGVASETGSIALPEGMQEIGLHVAGQGAQTRLILLAGLNPFYTAFSPWCGFEPIDGNVVAVVYTLDVEGMPQEVRRIELQGMFATSRLVGDALFLASSRLVQVTDAGAPILPQWRENGGPWQPMVTLESVWLPNFAPNDYERSLTTLSRFDLGGGAPVFVSLFARPELSYVAPGAWYLATSEYRIASGIVPSGGAAPQLDIHKLALPDLSYRASGSVPGSISTSAEGAFRFSERDGLLRVLTDHAWWSWSATTLFELSVLRENTASRQLERIASLPNAARPAPIGPPNEQAYGVRFVGDRAYAVSFFRTDPLYAIDLSDPLDPKLDSALEITGYSDYLHPLPGGFLLGVGRDATPASGGDGWGGAWLLGLKFSLFDQRDPLHPIESWRQISGTRGSDSALLDDHHAIAAAVTPDARTRIAIPIVRHDGSYSEPWSWAPWQFSGVASFEVDASGVVHGYREHRAVLAAPVGPPYRHVDGARTLLLGDSLFLLSNGHWYGTRFDATTPMTGPY
ncbi:MAG: beta-propeller domain-containing protein [Xanthomonadales bacterium]|nr:beta-propeller domain-containing protein [Xanthomonadales bacterium]